MTAKVDLYLAHEGKDSDASTSAGKGGHGGGKYAGQKGKLGNIEEGPQPDSVTKVAEKKKATIIKEEQLCKGQEIEKDAKCEQTGQAQNLQLLLEGGAFLWDCPEIEKLQKVSASSSENA